MSEKTKKLLADLGENPNLAEKFKENPERVMEKYEVPEDHQKLLLDGDKEGLIKAADLGDEHAQFIIL